MTNPAPETPWIIAHRGAMAEAPENTLAAFHRAFEHAIDGIEFDTQLTKDNVIVLHHDPTLARVAARHERISDLTYPDLLQIDTGAWFDPTFTGQRIVRLDEILKRYAASAKLLVEIKSYPTDKESGRSHRLTMQVLQSLQRYVPLESVDSIHVLSFDEELLEFAYDNDPNWRYVLNTDRPARLPARIREERSYLYAISAAIDRISRGFVDSVHDTGRRVMTYSCNTPKQVDRALETGVDVIMTDRPGWLLEHLAHRGRKR